MPNRRPRSSPPVQPESHHHEDVSSRLDGGKRWDFFFFGGDDARPAAETGKAGAIATGLAKRLRVRRRRLAPTVCRRHRRRRRSTRPNELGREAPSRGCFEQSRWKKATRLGGDDARPTAAAAAATKTGKAGTAATGLPGRLRVRRRRRSPTG